MWGDIMCRPEDHIWPDPNLSAIYLFLIYCCGLELKATETKNVLLVIKTILRPKGESRFTSDLIYPFYNTSVRSKKRDYFRQRIINL